MKSEDVEEHRAITDAVAEGWAEDAESLMARHVRGALRHWEPERRGSGGGWRRLTGGRSGS